MKIAIVSDSHDRAPELLDALRVAREAGAQAAIHCGDIIGANTLRPLVALGLPVHLVHGNNLGDPVAMAGLCARSNGVLTYYGGDADFTLHGRRIYVTHYPHQAHGMACTGDYDLVCCGHTHEAQVVQQANIQGGQTWQINPGTVAGIGAPARWILADLSAMSFEIRPE